MMHQNRSQRELSIGMSRALRMLSFIALVFVAVMPELRAEEGSEERSPRGGGSPYRPDGLPPGKPMPEAVRLALMNSVDRTNRTLNATDFFPGILTWRREVGVDMTYVPSIQDDRFGSAIGWAAQVMLPLDPSLALRLGAGYEVYTGRSGNSDLEAVPLTLSLLFGPSMHTRMGWNSMAFLVGTPKGRHVNVGLELGVRYVVTDYEDDNGTYDDGVTGFIGFLFAFGKTEGWGYELGVGYRVNISSSQNEIGEELSHQGLALKVGASYSF